MLKQNNKTITLSDESDFFSSPFFRISYPSTVLRTVLVNRIWNYKQPIRGSFPPLGVFVLYPGQISYRYLTG